MSVYRWIKGGGGGRWKWEKRRERGGWNLWYWWPSTKQLNWITYMRGVKKTRLVSQGKPIGSKPSLKNYIYISPPPQRSTCTCRAWEWDGFLRWEKVDWPMGIFGTVMFGWFVFSLLRVIRSLALCISSLVGLDLLSLYQRTPSTSFSFLLPIVLCPFPPPSSPNILQVSPPPQTRFYQQPILKEKKIWKKTWLERSMRKDPLFVNRLIRCRLLRVFPPPPSLLKIYKNHWINKIFTCKSCHCRVSCEASLKVDVWVVWDSRKE